MSALPTYPQRHSISKDEYLRMADAGVFTADVRLELMEGEIIEMAPIGSAHAAVVNSLAALLNSLCGDAAIVSVQNPVVVGERSVPQPDLALLRARSDRYFHGHPIAMDVLLAIEVADTTLRFDLERKAVLYAATGIAETWVIDLEKRIVHVLREPTALGYANISVASQSDTVRVGALPHVSVVLGSLLPSG